MSDGFTFVIHAGADKSRIAPIVRRLIDAGVSLWLDDPRHPDLRLTRDDLARLGGCMIEGSDWPRQRNAALQAASSFLVIVSDASLEDRRAQVQMEAAVAEFRELEAGTPVFPVPLSQDELERGTRLIGKRQGFKAYVELDGAGFRLTERGERDVEALIERLAAVAPPRTGLGAAGHTRLTPYHADRLAQTQELAEAFRERRQAESARLLLPVTLGTRDDRPDKFALSQLPERLVPKWLRLRGCEAASLPWPHFSRSDPERAKRFLVGEVLDSGCIASPGTVYHAQPGREDLAGGGFEACLRLWCAAWDALRAEIGAVAILPVLDIRSDQVARPPGFLSRMGAWAPRTETIAATLRATAGRLADEFAAVELLPLTRLGPVGWDCVERWLRDDATPALGEAGAAELRTGLGRTFIHPGMRMEAWAEHARRKLGGVAPPGGRA